MKAISQNQPPSHTVNVHRRYPVAQQQHNRMHRLSARMVTKYIRFVGPLLYPQKSHARIIAARGERSPRRPRDRNRRRIPSRLQAKCRKIFRSAVFLELLDPMQMNHALARHQLLNLNFFKGDRKVSKCLGKPRILPDASQVVIQSRLQRPRLDGFRKSRLGCDKLLKRRGSGWPQALDFLFSFLSIRNGLKIVVELQLRERSIHQSKPPNRGRRTYGCIHHRTPLPNCNSNPTAQIAPTKPPKDQERSSITK